MITKGTDRIIACTAFGIGIATMTALFYAAMPSASVDTALHYILVDGWFSWKPITDPTMSLYPPLAHIAAAALGRATFVPPFQALNLSSVIFAFTIYYFLMLGMQRRRIATTLIAVTAFLTLGWLMRNSWSIYGFEVIDNMFFAQAAGEAAFLGMLWIYTSRERQARDLIIMPLIVIALMSVYPLSAIKAAAALSLLWAAHLWRVPPSKRITLFACLAITSIGAGIALHPTFHFMARVANNGGGLNTWIGDLKALRIYNVALIVSSLALFGLGRRSSLIRPSFLIVAGITTAIVAALQDAAFAMGYGSEYAVRKHTFAIIGLLAAILISLLGETLARSIAMLRKSTTRSTPGSSAMISSTAAAIAVYELAFPHSSDISAFLNYQAEIRAKPSLSGIAISKNADFANWQNYVVTLVDLSNPIDLAVQRNLEIDIPYSGPLPVFELVSRQKVVPAECVEPVALTFSQIVRVDCIH